MLYIPVGMSKPIRVQGAFLSDEEVEAIVSHCISQQSVNYKEEMITEETQEEEKEDVGDERFDDAVQLVIEIQSGSVSILQSRLRIGDRRKDRLIYSMEDRRISETYKRNKSRIILVTKNEEETETS